MEIFAQDSLKIRKLTKAIQTVITKFEIVSRHKFGYNGIFKFLSNKTNQNIAENGTISISFSSEKPNTNNEHFRNWTIEGSNDGEKWEEIDYRSNNSSLNGNGYLSTFDIQHKQQEFYRFVRLHQTGISW